MNTSGVAGVVVGIAHAKGGCAGVVRGVDEGVCTSEVGHNSDDAGAGAIVVAGAGVCGMKKPLAAGGSCGTGDTATTGALHKHHDDTTTTDTAILFL